MEEVNLLCQRYILYFFPSTLSAGLYNVSDFISALHYVISYVSGINGFWYV